MSVRIASIVEGHGEVESLPRLIRRVLRQAGGNRWPDIKPPIRQPRQKIVKAGELERAINLAAAKIQRAGAIVIVLDSDDDLPCVLGPDLLQRSRRMLGLQIPISIVLARSERESWFIGAATSIAGKQGLSGGLAAPCSVEEIRGAKEWLNDQKNEGVYSAVVDQPALTDRFNLDEAAASCPSFARFRREILRVHDAALELWP